MDINSINVASSSLFAGISQQVQTDLTQVESNASQLVQQEIETSTSPTVIQEVSETDTVANELRQASNSNEPAFILSLSDEAATVLEAQTASTEGSLE